MTFCTYITFIANDKIKKYYIGKSKIEYIKSGYKGSGIGLKSAFKTFDKSEWTTVVLSTHETESVAYEMEAILVNENTLKDQRCLNLKLGGLGQQYKFRHTTNSKRKISDASKEMWRGNRDKMADSITRGLSNPEVRAKISASSIEAGKDQVLRKTRSVNAKRLIARPEHIAALMAGRFTPENNARTGATHTAINAKNRQERFPPELVQEIFNSSTPQRKLADEYGCSRSTIKKIKYKDQLFNYAWE